MKNIIDDAEAPNVQEDQDKSKTNLWITGQKEPFHLLTDFEDTVELVKGVS